MNFLSFTFLALEAMHAFKSCLQAQLQLYSHLLGFTAIWVNEWPRAAAPMATASEFSQKASPCMVHGTGMV